MAKENKKEFINPIDKDKIAENPGLLPYAHTVGSVVVKPLDKGRIKGNAMAAMVEQTNMDLNQIREQIELLARQAKAIQDRVEVSKMIYEADTSFEPIIGKIYHLYERKNGTRVLSMVAPNEWGRKFPFKAHRAKVRLLADHTWDVMESFDEEQAA